MHLTVNKLDWLGRAAEQYSPQDARVFHSFNALGDFLKDAVERRLITDGDYEHKFYEADGWERPFRWEAKTEGPSRVIRITSSGSNGRFEDGSGDDIYLEITVSDTGHVQSHIKRP
jgi:hypothetical protein